MKPVSNRIENEARDYSARREDATAQQDASLKNSPRHIQRIDLQRKLNAKRKRLYSIAQLKNSPRSALFSTYKFAGSSINHFYTHRQSATKLASSSEQKLANGQTSKNHTKNFNSIALTSFVSFVFGAMISTLLLIYTEFNALPIFTDNAKWQSTYPGDLILTIILIYFIGGALKGLAGLGMALISVPVIGLLYDPVLAATIV